MEKIKVNLKVNGKNISVDVKPYEILVDTLRERLGLTGTKIGCNEGDCGACTVIMNGKTVTSCLVLTASTEGADILTIEGIGTGSTLHPIQEAFIEEGAVQCGFCTPGMVLSAKALLDENPKPTEEQISKAIAGNLCRCTGYTKIVSAISNAADKINK